MKLRAGVITATSLVVAISPARAEVTKLGEFALGQKLAKSKFTKTTLWGCDGNLTQQIKAGKIVGEEFSPGSKCKTSDLEAVIKKEYGGAEPLISNDKSAKLWEGKTGSVIVATSPSQAVQLLAPGPGSKRTCFADDGFAAFWKTFKDGLAKPEVAAATFKFPVKDYEGKVVIKDAKAFAKKWADLIDTDDRKEIASGALEPRCSLGVGTYDMRLGNSNISLEATKTGEKWQWTEINQQSPG